MALKKGGIALATNKTKKRRRGSFFVGLLDRFTSFLYSLFNNGRVGTWMSNDREIWRESVCAQAIENGARRIRKSKIAESVGDLTEKSRSIGFLGAVRSFLFCLSLSVYGIFFMSFGFASVLMYYITIIIRGSNPHGASAVVSAVIIIICSIPLLVSSRSAAVHISESRVMRKVAVSFMGIPTEKLKTAKRHGGVELMLIFALVAIALGGLTYFVHPGYIVVAVSIIILFCVVTANPETGVVLTLAAVPFLQFTDASEIVLILLVAITAISYFAKLFRHRRVMSINVESILVLIFCGFILVLGIFSSAGWEGMLKSLYVAIIIFCGYFVTYNLMRGENKLHACNKVLAISFIAVSVIGVWNVFYDGIVDGVMYSIREYVQPILDDQSIGFYDTADVYGVLAVLAFPILFSYLPGRKTVTGLVGIMVLCGVSVFSVFLYGTYETVFAIIIEFCLFWLIYSNKTLNTAILLMIPVGMFIIIYPYLAARFNWYDPIGFILEHLPLSFSEAPLHNETVQSTLEMLFDGNLTGIGVGEQIYVQAHSSYAGEVSAGATNPQSFPLQIMCWAGIGGLVTFIIFVAMIFKSSYGYLLISRDRSIKRQTLALLCSLMVALLFGTVNSLWSDMRMLFLFWTFMGLLSGYVREGRDNEGKIEAEMETDTDLTEIELRFYK